MLYLTSCCSDLPILGVQSLQGSQFHSAVRINNNWISRSFCEDQDSCDCDTTGKKEDLVCEEINLEDSLEKKDISVDQEYFEISSEKKFPPIKIILG